MNGSSERFYCEQSDYLMNLHRNSSVRGTCLGTKFAFLLFPSFRKLRSMLSCLATLSLCIKTLVGEMSLTVFVRPGESSRPIFSVNADSGEAGQLSLKYLYFCLQFDSPPERSLLLRFSIASNYSAVGSKAHRTAAVSTSIILNLVYIIEAVSTRFIRQSHINWKFNAASEETRNHGDPQTCVSTSSC